MKVYIKTENDVIISYSKTLFKAYQEIETDLDIDTVDLCNYKYVDGQLIKLTEEKIQAYEAAKEVGEQDKLNAQLLQANAQQQLINASLLKQIADLQKGGN